jgi:CheY-like chemotaxis protein
MTTIMKDNRQISPTVMLVEDDDISRTLLHQLLQNSGYRIIEAVDGLEALKVAMRERPALILMDVDLPGLDGIGITRRIREDAALRNTLIVMVTAFDAPEIREAAFDAGCNEYLIKPLDATKLKALLTSVLLKKR